MQEKNKKPEKIKLTYDGDLDFRTVLDSMQPDEQAIYRHETAKMYEKTRKKQMIGYINQLEDVNHRLGNKIFSEVGRKDNRVLLAKSPIISLNGYTTEANFLLVSKFGFSILSLKYPYGNTPLRVGSLEAGSEIIHTQRERARTETQARLESLTNHLNHDLIENYYNLDLSRDNTGEISLQVGQGGYYPLFMSKEATIAADPAVQNHIAYLVSIDDQDSKEIVEELVRRRVEVMEKERGSQEDLLRQLDAEISKEPVNLDIEIPEKYIQPDKKHIKFPNPITTLSNLFERRKKKKN